MKFNENIKKLRENEKLSQEELAKKLNLNIETIRRYEQNKSKKIDFEHIELFKNYFNCTYNDLFE